MQEFKSPVTRLARLFQKVRDNWREKEHRNDWIFIVDVTHAMALLLKNQLNSDDRYQSFIKLIKDALETISFIDVEDWLAEVFGRSTLSKRKALFKGQTGRHQNCMNF